MKNNKYSLTGFMVSALLHSMIALPLVLSSYQTPMPQLETMQITINNFLVEDTAGQNLEPNEAPIIEDQLIEEMFEALKEEIVEDIFEPEPIIEQEVVEAPKPEPKPKPKKKHKKIDQNLTKVAEPKPMQTPVSVTQTIAPTQGGGLAGPAASSAGSDYLTTQGVAVESDIRGKIYSIISAYAQRHYPSSAQRRKQTGTVKVSFRYCKNGRIERMKIYASSGHEALDEAVMEAVEKTKKKFPHTDRDLDLQIPVKFVLK